MSGLLIVANRLNANAALKAKVPVKKQFIVVAQQGEVAPYLVMSQVSGNDGVHLEGQDEYPVERIQIDVVAAHYKSDTGDGAKDITDLVRAALINTIKAKMSAVGVKDVDIISTGMELTDYNDDKTAVLVISDYMVRWRKI
jgi:hypothetical protein